MALTLALDENQELNSQETANQTDEEAPFPIYKRPKHDASPSPNVQCPYTAN